MVVAQFGRMDELRLGDGRIRLERGRGNDNGRRGAFAAPFLV